MQYFKSHDDRGSKSSRMLFPIIVSLSTIYLVSGGQVIRIDLLLSGTVFAVVQLSRYDVNSGKANILETKNWLRYHTLCVDL